MPELLGEAQERVESLGRDGTRAVSDAPIREKPGDGRRQKLRVVLEVVCVAHDDFEEEVSCQMAVVLEKVPAEELLDQGAVRVFRAIFVSQFPRNDLVQLRNGKQADLSASYWRQRHLNLLYLLADAMEELWADRLDQPDVLEHDSEEIPVLAVVELSIVGVNFDFAPFGVRHPLQDNVKNLENLFSNARRQLFHFVVALDPRCQEVDHRPADGQTVRVEDLDRFLQQKLSYLVEKLATLGIEKRILHHHVLRLLQRKTPLADVTNRV